MRITIELRRPERRAVVSLFAVLLLAMPAVVLADHFFPDVPNSNTFHTQIAAIADAGITGGFDDGTYRPNNNVTRQAMAAFMHRGMGHAGWLYGAQTAVNTGSITVAAGADFTSFFPLRELTITVPGASNAFSPTQRIYLHGRVVFYTSFNTGSAGAGCPCEWIARIRDVTSDAGAYSYQTFESASISIWRYSFEANAIFDAPPGDRTFKLELALNQRQNTAEASFDITAETSLTALTFPFNNEVLPAQ